MTQAVVVQVGQCGNQIGCRFWDLALREYAQFNKAVLVDMEEGVVSEILQGPLRDVFHSTQLLTDVSGAGNNWAVGHMTYGSTYREKIVDKLRKAAEQCDCLQSFFLLNSMGGAFTQADNFTAFGFCVSDHETWRPGSTPMIKIRIANTKLHYSEQGRHVSINI
ncbi:tubulin epsilon chain-like isoform X3 [Nerophis ophidion]|uniref:tubulin epsilon chain-like isoform X3 n=1 Tax=Nerophis ophidion TaxID=159077 RepID=UPI002ADFD1A3|nr:tubulin epsilon chain-like isoform X3 [Nerophis ophidion]